MTTKKDCIEALKKFHKETRSSKIALYIKWAKGKKYPSFVTIYKKCGSWIKALSLAKIRRSSIHPGYKKTKKDCIKELKKFYKKTEKPFSTEYVKWSKKNNVLSLDTILDRCGTWKKALIEAGILKKEINKIRKERKQVLRKFKKEVAKTTVEEYMKWSKNNSCPHVNTILGNCFGRWNEAMLAIGQKKINKRKLKWGELLFYQGTLPDGSLARGTRILDYPGLDKTKIDENSYPKKWLLKEKVRIRCHKCGKIHINSVHRLQTGVFCKKKGIVKK